MYIKQVNKVGLFLMFLFLSTVSYGQIGVGTENPTQDFEVKGSVIFRDLERKNSEIFNRQVMSNQHGNLSAIVNSEGGMIFKNILKVYMENLVIVSANQSEDLGVKLQVEVEPYSETVVILTYNIPVYKEARVSSSLFHFATIQLIKDNAALYGGFRKFSFPRAYTNDGSIAQGMFIDGKYVDVVRNTSDSAQFVTYTLRGAIEGAATARGFFSDERNTLGVKTMGMGTFSAMVFNKTF